MFTPHHFALSVADLDATTTFYAAFGFQPHLTWKADDDSLQITHLALGGFILEIFCYATNAEAARQRSAQEREGDRRDPAGRTAAAGRRSGRRVHHQRAAG
jgi:catechol 2,3-dioxygenase-like lactoylglutathione lyase family enzyme